MNRTTALISVRPDGFVDGASMSGACDTEFREDAEKHGFEVREVNRQYAKSVVFTNISVNRTLLA